MKLKKVIGIGVVVLLVVGGAIVIDVIRTARMEIRAAESGNNMKQLVAAILQYSGRAREFPDGLDQIRPLIDGEGGSFDRIMKNPLTGEFPGYEYVKPTTGYLEVDPETVILLYQIRDGSQAKDLAVGYASGSIRDIRPHE